METLIAGIIVFFGIHSVSIFNANWRDSMQERLGEWAWRGIYSLISIIGFVLLVYGYDQARLVSGVLYTTPGWLRHVSMLLMIFVFPMFLAAYLPGRIKTTLKHPMLVGTKTWAIAHLLVNGSVADVLLFGSFLLWAVADRVSLKKRRPRELAFSAPAGKLNDVIAIVGGLAFYFAFVFWLHYSLIGVPVI